MAVTRVLIIDTQRFIGTCKRYGSQKIQFSDYVEVTVKGGNGGNGSSAKQYYRGIFKPDGGDGGTGGDIFITTSTSLKDFSSIKNEAIIRGGLGTDGTSNMKRGGNGATKYVNVPIGTIISTLPDNSIVTILNNENEEYHAAIGGRGGYGNAHAGTSLTFDNTTGFKYNLAAIETGSKGSEQHLVLELKTIADIGLVGFPNCGKSSLLNAISKATPKIACYPFTTLRPHVGTIHYKDMKRLVMADIPGIIKGASKGKGLGHSFLKHIERCQRLLLMVDVSTDDPVTELQILKEELEYYKIGMSNSILAIVINKIDLIKDATTILEIARTFPEYKILPISAMNRKNISLVRNALEEFSYIRQDSL